MHNGRTAIRFERTGLRYSKAYLKTRQRNARLRYIHNNIKYTNASEPNSELELRTNKMKI